MIKSNLRAAVAREIESMKTDRLIKIVALLSAQGVKVSGNDLDGIRSYLDRLSLNAERQNEAEWKRENRFRFHPAKGRGKRSRSGERRKARHTPRFKIFCISRFISYVYTYYEKTKNLANDPFLYHPVEKKVVEYAGTARVRVRT